MPPKKPKLGQNFLIDETARRAIADALGDLSARTVVEIGPGHGAITSLLVPRCRRLILIELDRALAAALRVRFRDSPHVEVFEADILRVDLADFGETVDVVGNLPYYITSDILLHLFAASRRGMLDRAVLMMQREVAERVAAMPGIREYGLLSATAQVHARIDSLFTLPPDAFSPAPEVHSTVLRLHFAPRFEELGVDQEGFDRFLHQIFAQKRKTLRNNLRAAGIGAEQVEEAWPEGIERDVRAEALTLDDAARLYRGLR